MADQNPTQDDDRKSRRSVELSWKLGDEEKKRAPIDFFRWAGLIVDALLFLAVASYTIVAWKQWNEMKLD